MKRKLLSEVAPQLRSEWDSEKNAGVEFDHIHASSSKRVSWICKANPAHRWETSIYHRAVNGTGCPYCAHRFIEASTSLKGHSPSIAAEWHPTRNGGLQPDKVPPSCKTTVWWRCAQGHEWQQKVQDRLRQQSRCPICREYERSVAALRPDLANEWHPTKNKELTAARAAAGSGRRVWWQCLRGHEWETRISARTKKGSGCPICAHRQLPARLASLAQVAPALVKEWHPSRNLPLTPEQVTAGSPRKVWWICSKNPEHVWQALVCNRARKGVGCPYCANAPITTDNSLARLRPDVAAFWDSTKNAPTAPDAVSVGSARRFWWRCSMDPSHEWDSTVTSLTSRHRKGICPFCSGARPSPSNNLATTHSEIAAEWHPERNAPLTPAIVTRASGKLVWWKCKANGEHEWQALIKNRTVLGTGCPHCEREKQLERYYQRRYEAAAATGDYIQRFRRSIVLLNRVLSRNFPAYLQVRRPIHGMIYASAVTAMETYLCDAFLHAVTNNNELMNRLLTTTPDFSEKRYSLADMIDWSARAQQRVADYIYDIAWHNLAKVRALYKTVLSVTFPSGLDSLYRAVLVRHDIVHRNGRSKDGRFHNIDKKALLHLFDTVSAFVESVDGQMKKSSQALHATSEPAPSAASSAREG